jgi:ATP-dependent Lhr-like helicase
MIEEYQRLDPRVQKWVFQQGWTDLRVIQKRAIGPILAEDTDVLISASTAGGKTEAFFLPACTAIADQEEGFGILYISPLKALINDQYRRLESLCELLDMQVTPWHGDAAQSLKKRAKRTPSGILLITPESLEALLILQAGWSKQAFSWVRYVVIDEFHAFLGSERGQQLLSILNRLEHLVGRQNHPIPRVALSATLGDLDTVPLSLRPNGSMPCATITNTEGFSTLKVQVKGYLDPVGLKAGDHRQPAEHQICEELFRLCRGDSHLVFANSRRRTESIAAQLSNFCEERVVPNEFFPHHGSLAKEFREDLEARLQQNVLPTTAVCTMTLELGIDIGKVNSVIQVTAPHSVSSLRQRMGRSGRRESAAVLRMLIAEHELASSSKVMDLLRVQLVQSLAMVRLLITNKWFEPADTSRLHFSTLVHQILATTAQWGGIRANQLYTLLCRTGPFQNVTTDHFKRLLVHLGQSTLLTQMGSGELVLGVEGEKLVNHYSFFAVFRTPEEFRVINGTKVLGTLPIDTIIIPEMHIVFGGRSWKVQKIDAEKRVIQVIATKGGTPPKFSGEGLGVHDVVRQEMFRIYSDGDYRIAVGNAKVDFLDSTAQGLFREGADFFHRSQMQSRPIFQHGASTYVCPWLGDKVVNTLVALLLQKGFETGAYAGIIEISGASVESVHDFFQSVLQRGVPTEKELAIGVPEKQVEKFDEFLPLDLLNEGFGQRAFECSATQQWLETAMLLREQ